MRYRTKLLSSTIIVFFTVITSCKKFVDVEIPKTLLYPNNVFNNNASATAAVTSIYSQMMNNTMSYQIPYYTGLSGDELFNYSTLAPSLEFYRNNVQPTNTILQSIWNNSYSYIYQCNLIIEGLQNSTGINTGIKNQLEGEVKFIRAFWNFYLTNLFGDIPIVGSTDYKVNSTAYRLNTSEVYQQILNDLKDAKSSLNSNFIASDDTTITTERTRPTKWAASSLLAKVYLYSGDWTNAESEATTIINNPMFDTVSLNAVFLKNNKESIWQLQKVSSQYNTPEGNGFILSSSPSLTSSTRSTSLSNSLLTAFEPGDLRKLQWVGSKTVGATTYFFPYKYKVQSGNSSTEYSVVFRLAEVYLIRAEARAQINKIIEGQSDLNVIRKRAGLINTTASDKVSLLDAIFHERQVEFFIEWGQRWFDLKRTNRIDAIMNSYGPNKGATWSSYKKLYPIPQNERLNDPNLTQNNGY